MSYLTFNKNSTDAVNLNEKIEATNIDITNPLLLQYNWVIWEQVSGVRSQNVNYQDCTKPLAAFNSVQGFWQLWNKLPQPSDLLGQKSMTRISEDGSCRVVDALMIFRENISPMWEDPMNAEGGHFEYKIFPGDYPPSQIDEFWNNIVLAIIGSNLKCFHIITGIRLVDKLNILKFGHIRIEIWFTRTDEEEAINLLKGDIEKAMTSRVDGSIVEAPKSKICRH